MYNLITFDDDHTLPPPPPPPPAKIIYFRNIFLYALHLYESISC